MPDVLPMNLQVTASFRGQYEFPKGCEQVSGVYCISFPLELDKPATLDIQHCIEITHNYQCSSLSFARCSQKNPPYKFELVQKDTTFKTHYPYGSVKTTHFSHWVILLIRRVLGWEQSDAEPEKQPIHAIHVQPTTRYGAHLFYKKKSIYSWMLHFVIIPNLEIFIIVSFC